MFHLNEEQVRNHEHWAYDPALFEFRWNDDFTEVVITPLVWWDEEAGAADDW